MFTASPLTVTRYDAPQHHDAALDLLARPDWLHTHLDWHGPAEWLHDPAVVACLAWQNRRPVGLMAAAPPRQGTAWLRLIALGQGVSMHSTMRALWEPLAAALRAAGVQQVGALGLATWLGRAVEALGFVYVEDVVTLSRTGGPERLLPPPRRSDLILCVAEADDLPAVLTLDHAAFDPLWQLDEGDLHAAWEEAASFTLAELEGEPVGYALCTSHPHNAHLTRLATAPPMQGQGVGGALLRHALLHFQARGVHVMTVNTQESNVASLGLYRRFGFHLTGYNIPVWIMDLL